MTPAGAVGRAMLPLRSRIADRYDRIVMHRFERLVRRGSRAADGDHIASLTLHALRRLRGDVGRGRTVAGYEEAVTAAFLALAHADREGTRPAPAVRSAILDGFHRLYYHDSDKTWMRTYWQGVPILKNPLDLWVYQEILHEVRPDIVVETGTRYGGSAFYFASIFDLLGHGHVVTIDVEELPNRPEHPRITYLTGSSTAPEVVDKVDAMIGDGRALVVLDSDHRKPHVLDELRIWHSRAAIGSYVIVEDSNINGHPALPGWGPGPMEALDTFLEESDSLVVDEARLKFLFSFNPRGYLKRVS